MNEVVTLIIFIVPTFDLLVFSSAILQVSEGALIEP